MTNYEGAQAFMSGAQMAQQMLQKLSGYRATDARDMLRAAADARWGDPADFDPMTAKS